jgi:hypothetical protein
MKRYFCTDVYCASDALTLEKAVAQFAELELESALIHEERIPTIVERLKWFQDETIKTRPRLRAVAIEDCGENDLYPGHRAIRIGTSQVNLTSVKCEIE